MTGADRVRGGQVSRDDVFLNARFVGGGPGRKKKDCQEQGANLVGNSSDEEGRQRSSRSTEKKGRKRPGTRRDQETWGSGNT